MFDKSKQENQPDVDYDEEATMRSLIKTVFNLDEDDNDKVSGTRDKQNLIRSSSRISKDLLAHGKAAERDDKKKIFSIPSFSEIAIYPDKNEEAHFKKYKGYLANSKSNLDMSFRTYQDYALHGHAMQDKEREERNHIEKITKFRNNREERRQSNNERRQTVNELSSSNKSNSKTKTISKNQSSSIQSLFQSSSSALVFIKPEDY